MDLTTRVKKPILNDKRLRCQIFSESHNTRRCQRYNASERRQIVVNFYLTCVLDAYLLVTK